MKNLFTKTVDYALSGIFNKFAYFVIDRLPDYFWHVPASLSGQYHPITDLGEGGLVRHSLMVWKAATDLIRATPEYDDNSYEKAVIQFAALFHDSYKLGVKQGEYTLHDHPIIAAQYIHQFCDEFIKAENMNNETVLSFKEFCNDVCKCISTHMGRWTRSKYSTTVLQEPITKMEKIVHMADYFASRKYCLFDNDFFNSLD